MTGRILRTLFHNEQSGYAVIVLQATGEAHDLTAVGYLSGIREGDEIRLAGTWVNHPKYGRQFKFAEHEILLPSGREGIVEYLASVADGIGPAKAGRIVDALGLDCLDKIRENPDVLRTLPFVRPEQAEQIASHLQKNQVQAELTALICRQGITPRLAAKIYAQFGARSLEVVKDNPYLLADEVWGVGFKTADLVARAVGVKPDSPFRVEAAVRYVLRTAAGEEGHVYLDPKNIVRLALDLLGKGSGVGVPQIAQAVGDLVARETLVREGNAVYHQALYHAECQVAGRMRSLAAREKVEWDKLDDAILAAEVASGIEYAPEQKEAIRTALTSDLSIITGGPGTGKTTVINAICDIYADKYPGRDIYLAAPTGRAAKRMTEATGREAKTIHRLLHYSPSTGGFEYGWDNPLPGPGLLVVDEGCLHWKTCVLLADGTREYIGKIVNSKMNVAVMSYNPVTGRLEPRKITRWWKYERKSPLLEIDISRNGSKRRQRLIRCTPQHMIATPEGYRRADSLQPGDRVLVRGRFLTGFQRQLILGSLLGDAHLCGLNGARKGSYQIAFTQGDAQKAYLDFKIQQFPGLFTSPPHKAKSGFNGRDIWQATMNLVDELDDLIPIIVRNGKVLPTPEYLALLEAPALAIWYLDNGSLHVNKVGSAFVTLHTERFDMETQEAIADYLRRILNAEARIQKYDKFGCIRLSKEASARFLDMVEPYIPPCMAHKHRCPEKAKFAPQPEPMIDVGPVPIRSIKVYDKNDGYDRHVYDLEIEGLHNYVAGNVVVHNSMVDLELARDLLAAVDDLQVVLVGDVDQLPSVGPGSVLRDAILSGVVPTVRLKFNYRQAGGSRIAEYANLVCQGIVPPLQSSGDFCFVEVGEADEVAPIVAELVKQALAEGLSVMDFQVLAPMRKGSAGVSALNELVRGIANPRQPGENECKGFRPRDKVMVVKNNYNLGVFNGDLGQVVDVGRGEVLVRFEEGFLVPFRGDDLDLLQLAYASTVHKAQGSEFPLVIMPLVKQHYIMLQRNLLYTGMTRAQKKLVLVADPWAVKAAVQNDKVAERFSRLAERLKGDGAR